MAFAIIVICCAVAYMIGNSKGRGAAGILLGLILGPLGIIAALFLQDTRKPLTPRRKSGKRRTHARR
jgi:hypothetical protein